MLFLRKALIVDNLCTLTDITKEAEGNLSEIINIRRSSEEKKKDSYLGSSNSDGTPDEALSGNGKQKEKTVVEYNTLVSGSLPPDKEGFTCSLSDIKEDTDEPDWEDGYIPTSDSKDRHPDNLAKGIVIEFDDSPSTSKRKPTRRASAEDKELAELAHKAHLLCLLARGRLVDSACGDPLIQASLLSLLPSRLLKIADLPKITADALLPLVNWFHSYFNVRSVGPSEKSFKLSLFRALENHEGTPEEVAALSVALFRALNLITRFVSILDVIPLKPGLCMSNLSKDAIGVEAGVFNSSTLMVTKRNQISPSPTKLNDHVDSLACNSSNVISQESLSIKGEGSKRKGDLEYELQLEMALSATAAGKLPCSSDDPSVRNIKKAKIEESSVSSQGIATAVGSRKVGAPLYWAEVFSGGENSTGKWVHVDSVNAIVDGEAKVEAAAAACRRFLRYVVAFAGNGAKDVTRRYCMKWYKIAAKRVCSHWWDKVLAPLRELESGATGGMVHLEAHPVNALKSPTVENHSTQDSNVRTVSRNSLEDMELETRALTEPLPTNQQVRLAFIWVDYFITYMSITTLIIQAYKTHHLYAMERWLTKYQLLHPKGPVLGYCSGYPVYPRTCVQTLQTKQRWLREGLQVKANESPAKVVKRSLKLSKQPQACEPGVSEEDNSDETFSLYGKWQTEPLDLPRAVNGIVPKNKRGQVDVWSEKCLPIGTSHLRFPRLVPVAKRLGVNFSPAMVGFEFRNGRSFPVYEGIVVCTEFKDAILEAYAEEEKRREAEEKKKSEAQALSRWYQLLSSMITRHRLDNAYGDGSSSSQLPHKNFNVHGNDDECGASITNRGNGEDKPFRQGYGDLWVGHEHTFPIEDQSFDEESSVTTKRCPCGFLIEVEEL
ncbi:hypothetical protein GIB67_000092 [Kingdonia uniflora]|uniref:DNA repair protein RAD4 n=1 Tax=Kingdonia uniflora TaxID=39325 RepID=A0A7J7M618_9MAGN|nr:hypothetical protein GIB67_000092 [Kingdonia uniflora]